MIQHASSPQSLAFSLEGLRGLRYLNIRGRRHKLESQGFELSCLHVFGNQLCISTSTPTIHVICRVPSISIEIVLKWHSSYRHQTVGIRDQFLGSLRNRHTQSVTRDIVSAVGECDRESTILVVFKFECTSEASFWCPQYVKW